MDYKLENNFLRITVRSKGAELVSALNKATGEEMLWDANPEVWNRHAPILFPYCGRLRDGKFTLNGATYAGGQHGFARDMEHILVSQADGVLTLCLEANALTMEKYPFAFKLFSRFWLEDSAVHHEIEVQNDGDEPMPFGFGYHPGVMCPFDAQHTTEDYYFEFDTPETPDVIECSNETGLTTGVVTKYFENSTQIPLTATLFDGGSLCFRGLQSKTLSVVELGTGRRVVFDVEGFPYVLVWSMPGPLQFVCVEPWHTLPDAHDASGAWEDKTPSITLQPAENWQTELTMTFAR